MMVFSIAAVALLAVILLMVLCLIKRRNNNQDYQSAEGENKFDNVKYIGS